jgi:hypothetical protein
MKSNSAKKWSLHTTILPSRRGDYKVATIDSFITNNMFSWTPKPLSNSKRDNGVKSEIQYAIDNKLKDHFYWENEPIEFVNEYQQFYKQLFSLSWLHNSTDRHNIVVNPITCLTLVQYHNGILYAYSRSTDMKNGYYSDKKVLDYLAEVINRDKPEFKVKEINWFLAIPHEYVNPGIARLIREKE